MPIQPPSLSELLAAYTNNGGAEAINSAKNGVLQGMALSSSRTKAQQDAQNALSELAIKKQAADAATRDANAKYVSGDALNAAVSGQPIVGEQPLSLADTLIHNKQLADAAAQHSEDLRYQADQANATRISNERIAAAQREAAAQEAAQARAAQTAATLQANRERTVQNAEANVIKAHSWLPWQTANEKIAAQGLNNANQAAGFGTSTPAATVRVQASDGSMHDLPAQNLKAAQERDPGLKVIE